MVVLFGAFDFHIAYLLEDSRSILWVNTRSGGVSKLQDNTWVTYTTADGLGGNKVILNQLSNLPILLIHDGIASP